MKPYVVADHDSANAAKYTRHNIEIQGLKLWLSGIGRPTGNARTERVIGTLKREEINFQEQYANETPNEIEGKESIKDAIWDYNFNRPNQGNGGYAPNSVHHAGRHELMKRRAEKKALGTRDTLNRTVDLNSHPFCKGGARTAHSKRVLTKIGLFSERKCRKPKSLI